ncbi:MAG: tetratricopeptide repeat protein [Verrucomicrobia bacterium]|nr:tetratricopeptide repeat protein [Verrucomicrobiota bacterium]
MLTTKKGAGAVHILFLICSAIFLFSGCAEPGPKALLEGERLIQEKKLNEAISRLQDAVELLPQNAQAWNHLGLAYQYSGQPGKALENYKRALEIDGNLAAARHNLGHLFFEQNHYGAAAADLTTYVILEPKNGVAWNKLATAQLRHSSLLTGTERSQWLNSARQNFEIALQFEQDPHIYNSLGVIEVQRGRARDSVRYFNQALQKQSNYPPAILNLAVVNHVHLKDKRVALQRYREFLAYQPRSSRLREVEAVAHQIEQELNPPQYVTNLVAQVLAPPRPSVSVPPPVVQPTPPREVKPEPRIEAAPRLTSPRTEPAQQPKPKPAPVEPPPRVEIVKAPEEQPIKAAQDIPVTRESPAVTPAPAPVAKVQEEPRVASTPVDPDDKDQKKRLMTKLNPTTWFRDKTNEPAPPKIQSAPAPAKTTPVTTIPSAREATAPPVRATYPRYRYSSPTLPKAGNRAEAARIFNEALQAQRQRDSARALESYRRATKVDPTFFEAQYNLGLVALERGSVGEALAAYESALAISPDSANARYNFAFALQKGNYLVDAANEFEKLLARNPRETRAHLSLANIYVQQGNRDLGRKHYQKVLEIEPNHSQATAIRYWLRDNP